jgi:ribosome biogenesis GTPase
VTLNGRIIEEQKNYYYVDTAGGVIQASLRGTLRSARPCVGDKVDIGITNGDTHEGLIRAIHRRKNFLPRPPLANMDQMVLMATLTDPQLDTEALDRFLFFSGCMEVTALILFNKVELLDDSGREELGKLIGVYRAAGYQALEISAITGKNVAQAVQACEGRLSFLAGASGVGKTTLLARLFPLRELRTAGLSRQTRRGVHTTTSISLLKLSCGGYIADTPGFSLIELPVIPYRTVMSYFPDMACCHGLCRFNDCAHDNEPGCAVKNMVAEGKIAQFRYDHYLKIFHEMKQRSSEY